MQFSVQLRKPDSSKPLLNASRKWAEAAILADLAVKTGQNSIQLTIVGMTWPQAKSIMRGKAATINAADSYHCLPYTFPLPYDLLRHYR